MRSWPSKDPDEVLDYQLDWADDVDPTLEDGETISTSAWAVVEGNVTIGSTSNVSGVTTVWLSGGTLGEVCIIRNRVVTSAGRTYDQSVRLRIRSK